MSEGLTMKQEAFAEEYVKTLGNGVKAVDKAYPGHTSYSAKGSMACENLKKPKVKARIEELKGSILEDLPAIGEHVMRKIKKSFDTCKTPRDLDKLGRTLLEVAGFLGSKPQTAIQINIAGSVESLDKLGLFDLLKYKEMIEKALAKRTQDCEELGFSARIAFAEKGTASQPEEDRSPTVNADATLATVEPAVDVSDLPVNED